MIEKILTYLMSLAIASNTLAPETTPERAARMQVVAQAVVDEIGLRPTMLAAVLVQGKRESGFDAAVGRCQCHPWQCDSVHGIPMAHGYWQQQDAWSWQRGQWAQLCDADYASVRLSVRLLVPRINEARLACSFARLGNTSTKCGDEPQWALDRESETRQLAARLTKP